MVVRSIHAIYTLYVSSSPVAGWSCADSGSTAWTSVGCPMTPLLGFRSIDEAPLILIVLL